MRNRTWIIIFSSVLVVCALIWFLSSYSFSVGGNVVGIYQNSKLIKKIDLKTVTQDYEITVNGTAGENVIQVSHGKIRMKSAHCPDKICVNHGELEHNGSPIVCLPNKIIIKYE